MPKFSMNFASPRAERRMAAIERLLSDGVPRTAPAIAVEVLLDKSKGLPYLRHMHSLKRVHIKKWKRAKSPMFVAGPGKDAKEPKIKTAAEVQRDYYHRNKNNPEFIMRILAKDRLRRMGLPKWTGSKQRHYAEGRAGQ